MKNRTKCVRVLLADPPVFSGPYDYYHPTMGILYLLGALKRYFGSDIVELAYLQGHMNLDKHLKVVDQFGPDIYGLSFKSYVAPLAYTTLKAVKESFPELIVVAGGAHPSAMPEEVMAGCPVDACFRGECEHTLPKAVATLFDGNIRFDGISGVVHRKDGRLVSEPISPFDSNLDAMPRPAWEFVDFKLFPGMPYRQNYPYAGVTVSRGCPFHCTFCSEPVWKIHGRPTYRARSVDDIIDEVIELYKLGVREIRLWCEELNCDYNWALELLRGLENLEFKDLCFSANVRGDKITPELAAAVKSANLWLVNMGIESASNRTLDGVRKQITIEKIEMACQELAKAGVMIMGYFQFFLAWEESGKLCWETATDARRTLRWVMKMHRKGWLHYIGTTIASARPASPLWSLADKHCLFRGKMGDPYLYQIEGLNLPGVSRISVKTVLIEAFMAKAWIALSSGNVNSNIAPHYAANVVRRLLRR